MDIGLEHLSYTRCARSLCKRIASFLSMMILAVLLLCVAAILRAVHSAPVKAEVQHIQYEIGFLWRASLRFLGHLASRNMERNRYCMSSIICLSSDY